MSVADNVQTASLFSFYFTHYSHLQIAHADYCPPEEMTTAIQAAIEEYNRMSRDNPTYNVTRCANWPQSPRSPSDTNKPCRAAAEEEHKV